MEKTSKRNAKPEQTKEELLAEIKDLKENLEIATNEWHEAADTVELQLQDIVAIRKQRDLMDTCVSQTQTLLRVMLFAVDALCRVYRIDAAKELGDG